MVKFGEKMGPRRKKKIREENGDEAKERIWAKEKCSLMLKWVGEKMFLQGWIVVEERM
jgi:hypothetical protein